MGPSHTLKPLPSYGLSLNLLVHPVTWLATARAQAGSSRPAVVFLIHGCSLFQSLAGQRNPLWYVCHKRAERVSAINVNTQKGWRERGTGSLGSQYTEGLVPVDVVSDTLWALRFSNSCIFRWVGQVYQVESAGSAGCTRVVWTCTSTCHRATGIPSCCPSRKTAWQAQSLQASLRTTLLAESRAETLQDQAASCGWGLKAATGNAAGVLFATTYSTESNCPSRLALDMQCLAWQVVWC